MLNLSKQQQITYTTILNAVFDEHSMMFLRVSKVKRFKQESSDKQTDKQTNGRYQTYYLPCFAVDNKST